MSTDKLERQSAADAIRKTVTSEDVQFIAQRYTGEKSIRVLHYHIANYSEGPLGFLGSHRVLNVTLQRYDSTKSEEVSFFVKSMPYDCKKQADFMRNEGIFIKESNFFRDIVPRLEKHCKANKWHPICYVTKKDTMIMEDLRVQGYRVLDKTFDDTKALKSVLASLARLHSCSILTESHLNRSLKQSIPLNEHYPGYFDEKLFTRDSKMTRWFNSGADVICLVAKNLGYDTKKLRKAFEHCYSMIGPSKIHQNVICHGDPWSNNIMIADDSPLYKCILVDFQVTRYAPLVIDLLQFLHLNATKVYRDNYERDLIGFYYSVLKETILNNDSTGDVKMPKLEDVLLAMDDLRLIGLLTSALYFPIALMDAETVADHTKDSDNFDSFMFGNRIEPIVSHMKVNDNYRINIEKAVIELADKCDSLYQ